MTSDGLYRFDNLPSGSYDLSIEAPSFGKTRAKSVKFQVGVRRDFNVSLNPQSQKQVRVLVSTEVPLVETTKITRMFRR